MKKEIPICANCKHYLHPRDRTPCCVHPSVDPIGGGDSRGVKCSDERNDNSRYSSLNQENCGPSGKNWEPAAEELRLPWYIRPFVQIEYMSSLRLHDGSILDVTARQFKILEQLLLKDDISKEDFTHPDNL